MGCEGGGGWMIVFVRKVCSKYSGLIFCTAGREEETSLMPKKIKEREIFVIMSAYSPCSGTLGEEAQRHAAPNQRSYPAATHPSVGHPSLPLCSKSTHKITKIKQKKIAYYTLTLTGAGRHIMDGEEILGSGSLPGVDVGVSSPTDDVFTELEDESSVSEDDDATAASSDTAAVDITAVDCTLAFEATPAPPSATCCTAFPNTAATVAFGCGIIICAVFVGLTTGT